VPVHLKDPERKVRSWQGCANTCERSRPICKKRLVVDGIAAVPVHLKDPERILNLFGKVNLHKDGEWWKI